ncbi:MAG: hypothetical protein KBC96_11920 [Armatimonadetes bacterium]|nr:hypothetical protein [Armatimonadota bacterium]
MRNIKPHMYLIGCLVVLSAIGATPLWAVSRTTPVEVTNKPLVGIESGNNVVQAVQLDPWYMNILGTPNFNVANSPTVKIDGTTNTVRIDGTTNTVKAAQSGTWSVGLTGTPSVAQSGTWNVGITGTPSVSVSNTPSVNIANAPSVSVSNSPTVKIDATTNAVDTPTKHNSVQIWATNQTVPTSSNIVSPAINCAGYDELRFMLYANTSSVNLTAYIMFSTPSGTFLTVKQVAWSPLVVPITCPVYGDTCKIDIYNSTGSSVVIYYQSCVYMVN